MLCHESLEWDDAPDQSLALINNDVARKIGLPGDTVNINLNVAGGGVVTKHAKEVSFQLVSIDKSFVSKPMYAVTTSSVGGSERQVSHFE